MLQYWNSKFEFTSTLRSVSYITYTLQGAFSLGGKAMSNEENIPVLTKTDLITLLQNMDDQVILTINLEGDAEDGEA